jgi:hypothetical protein
VIEPGDRLTVLVPYDLVDRIGELLAAPAAPAPAEVSSDEERESQGGATQSESRHGVKPVDGVEAAEVDSGAPSESQGTSQSSVHELRDS